jgi:hypothetical protein
MTKISFSEPLTGLPPERDEGTFIGFDKDDNPYILRWHVPSGCYYGTGNDVRPETRAEWENWYPDDRVPIPLHFLCREDMGGFIVRHARIMPVSP